MKQDSSPYYPPRAPWYSGLRELGCSFLSALRLDRVRAPEGVRPGAVPACLLIPGFPFLIRRGRRTGTWAMTAAAVLFLAGVVGLGRAWGGASVALLIGIHASGLLEFLRPWLLACRPRLRLVSSVFAVMALVLGLYLPLQDLFGRHVAYPVRTADRVVIIRPGADPDAIRRGDWVAYHVRGSAARGVVILDGVGLARVLARVGDRVEFSSEGYRVNGRLSPARDGMPVEGSLVVRPGNWFIWPELRVFRAGAGSAESALYELAFVPYDELIGRPYEHWFFMRQVMP